MSAVYCQNEVRKEAVHPCDEHSRERQVDVLEHGRRISISKGLAAAEHSYQEVEQGRSAVGLRAQIVLSWFRNEKHDSETDGKFDRRIHRCTKLVERTTRPRAKTRTLRTQTNPRQESGGGGGYTHARDGQQSRKHYYYDYSQLNIVHLFRKKVTKFMIVPENSKMIFD